MTEQVDQLAKGPPAVTVKSLLSPAYEPGDPNLERAQLVDGQWWNPVFGCDSLQMVVDNARAALAEQQGEGPSDEEMGHQPTLSADDIPPGDDWRAFTPFEPCWDQVWPDLHGAWPVRP